MLTITGRLDTVDSEDSGMALIGELTAPTETGTDGMFFLRLQSYDETRQHVTMRALMGKRLHITIVCLSDDHEER
jgi:hypothetical protein